MVNRRRTYYLQWAQITFYHDAHVIVIIWPEKLASGGSAERSRLWSQVSPAKKPRTGPQNTCAATAVRCTPRSAVWTATTSTTTALRALVRHCLVELDQDGIWLTGGIAEFWSLTTDELKEVVAGRHRGGPTGQTRAPWCR